MHIYYENFSEGKTESCVNANIVFLSEIHLYLTLVFIQSSRWKRRQKKISL